MSRPDAGLDDAMPPVPSVPPVPPGAAEGAPEPQPLPASTPPLAAAWTSASSDLLFHAYETRCDVCSGEVELDEDGLPAAGTALYVWSRGGEVRREEPPLCVSCSAALGMTALAEWGADEEEG